MLCSLHECIECRYIGMVFCFYKIVRVSVTEGPVNFWFLDCKSTLWYILCRLVYK